MEMWSLGGGSLQAWDSTTTESLDFSALSIDSVAAADSEGLNENFGFMVLLRKDGTVGVLGDTSYAPPINISSEQGFKALAAGSEHALALRNDDVVIAWGSNEFGQTDVPSDLSDVIAIDAAINYSMALKSDGTVVEWGGRAQSQFKPMPADLKPARTLTSNPGFNTTWAIHEDKTLNVWSNYDGAQFPHPYDYEGYRSTIEALDNVTDVSVFTSRSIEILTGDGRIISFGQNHISKNLYTLLPM